MSHRYEDNGEYIVTLAAVEDPSVNRTTTVTVNNVAPIITELNGDRIFELGDVASFSAVATDPGNDVLTYTWDLGDGTQLTGEAVDHNFTDVGTYTVTLTVTDDDGGIASETMQVIVKDSDRFFNLKAEGKVRINGRSDLEGEALNTDDDTHIYGKEGFTINGNHDLPVQRDANGNPIQVNGRSLLVDRAVAVSPGFSESNASASKNKYEGIVPPQVIDPLSVFVPEHSALIDIELSQRIAPGTEYINFNPQQNPLNNQSDWDDKFPAPGTEDAPTVVTISNDGLNIPSNIDISNYVIIVENGNINFNGSDHNFDNVVLVAQNGSINLASVQSNNLSVFASNTININSGARFAGETLIAMGDSNGSLHFDGATSTLDGNSNLEVVSQGNIIFNSSSTTKGEFTAANKFTANGRADLIGSIQVKGDIIINGGIDIISTFDGDAASLNQTNAVSLSNEEDIIYQFVNTDNSDFGGNFYTSDDVEKDYIISNLDNYQYEGEIFESTDSVTEKSEEVYRFFNTETGNHFYTTDLVERDSIIANLEHFSYEGVAFTSYTTQVEGSTPMYRFYQPDTGIHFYTSDEAEMISLRDAASEYSFEGIAYYVKPLDNLDSGN